MECPSCLLRYNVSKRRPNIIDCGHTICLSCQKTSFKCKICNKPIDPKKTEILNYSLMDILQKDARQIDKYIKVCFVGSSMVGKTSLIRRLLGSEFSQETVTTIGYDFSFCDRTVDELLVRYQLWDSAGQEKYRAISPIHYKNADIVAIVYDTSQSESDNRLSYWIEETLINCNNNAQIIIVGNKTDIANNSGGSCEAVDERTLIEIRNENYPHLKVSCLNGQGLQQFWHALDNQFRARTFDSKKGPSQLAKQAEQFEKKNNKLSKIKNPSTNKIAIKCKSLTGKKQTCC